MPRVHESYRQTDGGRPERLLTQRDGESYPLEACAAPGTAIGTSPESPHLITLLVWRGDFGCQIRRAPLPLVKTPIHQGCPARARTIDHRDVNNDLDALTTDGARPPMRAPVPGAAPGCFTGWPDHWQTLLGAATGGITGTNGLRFSLHII